MSEELLQRDLINNPDKIGKWDFYNIGATSIKALKGYGIIRNIDYGKLENKKIDALIVQKKQVIAVVEYKTPTQFKTKEQKDKAIQQEIEVAEILGAKLIIATDTQETIWVNTKTGKRVKDETGKELKINFNPKDDKIVALIEKINYSINELNDSIKPKKLVNPTDLAKQIWQDIWSVSGATPENCLYTFVELFIFKYLSDLGVLGQGFNFDHLMERYDYKTDNSSEAALEYYAGTIRPKIKDLFPQNEIDKTTIINGTIFVSKDQKAVKGYNTVFKKVLDKFKDYGKLENIDLDFKSQLFESFLKESISKKNWGQFFTPLKVVRAIVEMAKDEIKDGSSICDPACGVGKFLLEPIVTRLDQFYKIDKNGIKPKITLHGYDKGFDKDEQKTIILAKANMLIYFSDLIKENPALTKDFSKLFNESFILKTNSILGTLSETVENEYDLILTNPPYVTSGSSNLKEEIKKDKELENYYKINSLGVEGLFMEWIIKALKPGGKAFVVIPDGILNRQNDKHLRKYILDECYLDGIISLPAKTFFTTIKKTYILCITKKINKSDFQTSPVFTYLVSEIGETRDVYRFDIEQNDLQEAVTLFSFFKGNKENFGKFNTDKRCKIQEVNKFQENLGSSWIVENWWSKDEKIKLGIIEEDKFIKFDDFPLLLEEISNNLNTLREDILSLNEKKKANIDYVELEIHEMFDILGEGSNLTKNFLEAHKGIYPVYSGQTENSGVFGFINTYKYNEELITWTTYGVYAGSLFKRKGKFNIGRNACGLKLKNKYIDLINLDYIVISAENVFTDNAKGEAGKHRSLPQSIAKSLKIKIPLDNDKISIEKQQEVFEKYQLIEETKTKVAEYKAKINQLVVEIDANSKNKFIKIEDIFDLSIKTNSSKFTKTFIEKNKGNIPVYSASKFPDSVDYGYVKDNLKDIKYFEDCLTWNIDGSIGKAHYRKGRFSLSEKVIPLIVKSDLKNILNIDFLKNIIETEFNKHSFDFGNKAGKGKIQKIEISIPINDNGEFDLVTQKEIADKYRKIEEIKATINKELDKIQSTNIEIE